MSFLYIGCNRQVTTLAFIFFARFITGFFLGGIPWYIGTFILLCVRVDYREKPGYVACTVAVSVRIIQYLIFLLHQDVHWLYYLFSVS